MRCDSKLFSALNQVYSLGFTETQISYLKDYPNTAFEKIRASQPAELVSKMFAPVLAVARKDDTIAIAGHQRYYGEDQKIVFFKIRTVAQPDNEDVQVPVSHISALPAEYTGYYYLPAYFDENSPFCIIDNIKDEDFPKLLCINLFLSEFLNNAASDLLKTALSEIRVSNVDHLIRILGDAFFEIAAAAEVKEDRYKAFSSKREVIITFLSMIFPSAKITSADAALFSKLKGYSNQKSINTITDVIEIRNRRYALCMCTQETEQGYRSYRYGDTSVFYLRMADHTDTKYDYVDIGRVFITRNAKTDPILGGIAFTDEKPLFPSKDVIDDYLNSTDETLIASNTDIGIIVKRYKQKQDRLTGEQEEKRILAEKLRNRVDIVKTADKSLNLNGVVFKKGEISYEKQILRLDITPGIEEDWVYDLLYDTIRYVNIDTINFDNIFEYFIQYVSRLAARTAVSGVIGDVTFHVERKELKNANNVRSTLTYINSSRINAEEVEECLQRALCFTTQKDFNYFLSEVSKCSLKIHKSLQRGVSMTVRDEFNDCWISMKLPIVRSKNINYLIIKDKEFKIKDTHRIIQLSSAQDLVTVLDIFMNPKILEGMGFSEIRSLVDAAKKEYIDAEEKSKKLLKETEERFNIQINTYRFTDGHNRRGYLIKGKLDTYLVEVDENSSESKNGTYRFPSGQYVCIVDKSTAQVGMDKLVNRIYALHNDSVLANQIHTLR